jgi:hypothetical protein
MASIGDAMPPATRVLRLNEIVERNRGGGRKNQIVMREGQVWKGIEQIIFRVTDGKGR